ncbi:MAG: HEAT repeat domain-containing protein, partial [Gemmatimonadales bacterium]|nr:HEAT repeat domain-containing protein [Gemmatimonadales bacterium]
MVHLLRVAPEAREQHKAAFLDLQAEMADDGLRFSVDQSGLAVGGVVLPAGTPGLGELQDVVEACGVREIRIPPRVHPALLLSLLRALAHPGELNAPQDLIDQFDPAGTGEIQVLSGHHMPAADNLINLPTIETSADQEVSGTVSPDAANREADADLLPGLMRPTPGDEEYLIGPIQPDPRKGSLLKEIEPQVKAAAERGDWEGYLDLLTRLFQEQERETDPRVKERYVTLLRRVLPRSTQESLAQAVVSGTGRAEAVALFNRLGAEPTEVLLELLAAAPTLAERRTYFTMLSHMREGTRGIINRLDHPDWFVVRNIAELCGELRLTEAISRLAEQVEHPDERVRRAVAAALGKIGSSAVAQPLRKALWDSSVMVRLDALQAISRETGRGLVMTLSLRLDEEEAPEVQRQICQALGRIGSPDAVQTLLRSAQPRRGVFARKRTTSRVAAVEALGLAEGPVVVSALQDFLTD